MDFVPIGLVLILVFYILPEVFKFFRESTNNYKRY